MAALRAAVAHQFECLGSGHGHSSLGLCRLSRCAIIASSLLYLGCAAQWHLTGFPVLGALFCLVAALSSLADGCSDLLPLHLVPLARQADRAAGTAGLLVSVWHNCTTIAMSALCFATTTLAVWLLLKARYVATSRPHARREWVVWQSMWHLFGAVALCGLIQLAHIDGPVADVHHEEILVDEDKGL